MYDSTIENTCMDVALGGGDETNVYMVHHTSTPADVDTWSSAANATR